MKKILLFAISLVAFGFTASALEPVGIVFPYTGEPANISCQLVNYGAQDGIEPIYTESIGQLTPNSSGILYFQLGKDNDDWAGIAATDVSSYYVVNVKVGEDIKAQFRLDELIKLSARTSTGATASTKGEFTTAEELAELTDNILVYNGDDDISLSSGDLNNDLPENATYMIVNHSDDSNIDFVFPPEVSVTIAPREYVIILKVGEEFYFAPQPQFISPL